MFYMVSFLGKKKNYYSVLFFVCQLAPRGHRIPTLDDYANITKCLNIYSYFLSSVI